MPLNLAVFSPNLAQDVIDAYPEINCWAVGGHSLGGSMAAQCVSSSPSDVKALLLLASYPASGNDLSGKPLKVLTIQGSRDGLVSYTQIDDSLNQLPEETIRVEIMGGNHAQRARSQMTWMLRSAERIKLSRLSSGSQRFSEN